MDYKMDNIITLNDENGNEVDFEVLDLIEYLGKEYIVLYPCDDDDNDASEVIILEVEDNDDDEGESFVSVRDFDVLYEVFDIFKEKFKNEFNFLD